MLPLILLSLLLPGTVLAQEAISQAAPVAATTVAPVAATAATTTAAAAAATSSSGGAGSGSGSNSNSGSSSGSSIPFGEPITKCRDQNAFALSFDDGPFQFTDTLLDTLQKNKLKATFFVNGKNFGNISNMASVLKRMLNEGHQIGSHTYVSTRRQERR